MSMNNFLKSLLVALLVTSSASAATLYWTGAVSTDFMTAGNWSLTSSVPSAGQVPIANDTTNVLWLSTFTPINLPHMVGTVPVLNVIVGTAANPATLYMDAGTVFTTTTGNYQFGARSNIYQTGGTVVANGNMWIHQGSSNGNTSIHEMTGGSLTVNSGKTFTFLNRNTAARAWLNVYGGSFTNNGNWRVGDSTTAYTPNQWGITLRNSGRLVWPWNKATTVGYITATTLNLKTGDAKQGLVLNWNTANTYLTATARYGVATPLLPLDGVTVQPGAMKLTWMKPQAFYTGGTMNADVRWGTYLADVNGVPLDPNGDNLPVIASGVVDSNYTVTSIYQSRYQWRIDMNDSGIGNGDANYPKVIKSRAMYYTAANQAPVVTIATNTTVSHPIIGLRAGTVTFVCTATATDDALPPGGPALTYTWSQITGPPVTITPVAVGGVNRAMSVTMTSENVYTFRLSVSDGEMTGTADVVVTVYANRCVAAQNRSGYTAYVGDLNADCWVTFADVALMCNNWLVCNSLNPLDPACL
jgi:hypothetical protein